MKKMTTETNLQHWYHEMGSVIFALIVMGFIAFLYWGVSAYSARDGVMEAGVETREDDYYQIHQFTDSDDLFGREISMSSIEKKYDDLYSQGKKSSIKDVQFPAIFTNQLTVSSGDEEEGEEKEKTYYYAFIYFEPTGTGEITEYEFRVSGDGSEAVDNYLKSLPETQKAAGRIALIRGDITGRKTSETARTMNKNVYYLTATSIVEKKDSPVAPLVMEMKAEEEYTRLTAKMLTVDTLEAMLNGQAELNVYLDGIIQEAEYSENYLYYNVLMDGERSIRMNNLSGTQIFPGAKVRIYGKLVQADYDGVPGIFAHRIEELPADYEMGY